MLDTGMYWLNMLLTCIRASWLPPLRPPWTQLVWPKHPTPAHALTLKGCVMHTVDRHYMGWETGPEYDIYIDFDKKEDTNIFLSSNQYERISKYICVKILHEYNTNEYSYRKGYKYIWIFVALWTGPTNGRSDKAISGVGCSFAVYLIGWTWTGYVSIIV